MTNQRLTAQINELENASLQQKQQIREHQQELDQQQLQHQQLLRQQLQQQNQIQFQSPVVQNKIISNNTPSGKGFAFEPFALSNDNEMEEEAPRASNNRFEKLVCESVT